MQVQKVQYSQEIDALVSLDRAECFAHEKKKLSRVKRVALKKQ